MDNLIDFAKDVDEMLRNASRQPQWSAQEAERYMSQVESQKQRFIEIASNLADNIIEPRMVILAERFSHANLVRGEPTGRSSCRFGYCERFPVNARIAITVEHDVTFENFSVLYEASIRPAIVKYDEQDRYVISLDHSNEKPVVRWVQRRLLSFLKSYLQVDRGRDDFEDEVVTDPVCGMRIYRSSAIASTVFRGHPYFFCSSDCHQSFSKKPTEFVQPDPTFDG